MSAPLSDTDPEAGDDEIKVLFARIHFGDELADGLARDLAARRG